MNYVYDDGGVYIKNLANCGEKYGIGQYRFAHNYELAGKDFTITAGDREYKLAFRSKTNVVFEGKEYAYECLKLELNTYFVRFGLNVAVVDLEQRLVTLILGDEYIYGAIGCPDQKSECRLFTSRPWLRRRRYGRHECGLDFGLRPLYSAGFL